MKVNHILISRTDAIGDVVLTLPICGIIKSHQPNCKISFLGNSYTKDIICACEYVDKFINYDDWEKKHDAEIVEELKSLKIDSIIHILPRKRIAKLAFKAEIPIRIGTTNRLFHWFNCNKLVQVSRKNSELHESELNIKLLKGLGLDVDISLGNIPEHYGLSRVKPLPDELSSLLSRDKFNLIIHPKSRGNGKEWDLEKFAELARMLDKNRFKIFVTGSHAEAVALSEWVKLLPHNEVVNMAGALTLEQFLAFIKCCDGLLASGTGPVHLAAALGIHALGLYPNCRPIHAGRWAPVGIKAQHISSKECSLESIEPSTVYKTINNWTT